MKRMLNNKLFYFILGAIIFSTISVYAVTMIDSKEVSFTPNNTDWEVSNVSEAIDELYEMNEFVKTVSSAECVSGTFVCDSDCTGSGKVIVSGFTPSEFIVINTDRENITQFLYYNKKMDSSYVYSATSVSFARKFLLDSLFDLGNNMLSVHDWQSDNLNRTSYYIACKE